MQVPKKAMVLAAGLGTRLRPLTESVPKALLDVGGRPMIEYPLRMLAAAGVEEAVVNLHHCGEKLRARLGDGRSFGLRLRYSPEDPILDTGGAIAWARPLLDDAPFFVVNSDTLLDVDLHALAALHETNQPIATLVLRADPQAERYGAIDIDAAGRIRRFLGRPTSGPGSPANGSLQRRMFCGVHLLSPAVFDWMPRAPVFSITRDVYLRALEAGGILYGLDYAGYWRDLGTLETLEAARADLTAGRFTPSYVNAAEPKRP